MPLSLRSSLEVSDDFIVYRETGGVELWRLAVADVLLIAENTTTAGPADDWFLQFGTICEGEPCLTGCPVPGDCEAFLDELGELLGAPLKLKLFRRADFASRVMWPANLAGRPLYVQRETARHVGLARFRRRLFGGDTEWVVSAEVFEAMLKCARPSTS